MLCIPQQNLRKTQIFEHCCFPLFSLPDLYKVPTNARITARVGQILIFKNNNQSSIITSLWAKQRLSVPRGTHCRFVCQTDTEDAQPWFQDQEGDGTFEHSMAQPDTPLVTSKAFRPTVNLAQPQKSKLTAEFNNCNTLQLSCSYCNVF